MISTLFPYTTLFRSSHDRYFLDKLVSTVYEITYRHIQKYTGTYTQFLHEKSQNYERDLKMYEKQQQEIKMMEDFIQRNIARASTTKRAQSSSLIMKCTSTLTVFLFALLVVKCLIGP